MPHESLQDTLNTFLEDEAGVPFERLADFAEPLFELYQVDLRTGLQNAQDGDRTNELASLVAVLETARLLWVFLGMRAPVRRDRFSALQRILVGPDAGEAESQDLRELLATLKARRNQLEAPEDEDVDPAAFDELLTRYAERNEPSRGDQAGTAPDGTAGGSAAGSSVASGTYGPNALPPDQARALFAQPLLEAEEVLQDPSQMQEALDRAETYWDLAHAAPRERRKRLVNVTDRFAESEQEEKEVKREARAMMERFDRLFPGRN